MPLCPFATSRGPVPNRTAGGMITQPHGLIPHVIVGSLASADLLFHQKTAEVSAHFGVGKDGRLVQWVDTADKAWAEEAGNSLWWSAECEGLDTEPHTPAQIDTLAHLLVWLHGLSPFPLQVTDDPNGQGVTSHRCGGIAWGNHSCPGDQRHHQRGEIVLRAKGLLALPPPAVIPFPEDHMHRIAVQVPELGDGTGWWDLDGVAGRPLVPWNKYMGVEVNGGGVPRTPDTVHPADQDGHTRLWLGGFAPGAQPLLLVLVAD